MRQVPQSSPTLIVGDGRLARHFSFYFDLIQFPFRKWSRNHQSEEELQKALSVSKNILLCISDDQIESFYNERKNPNLNFIHFSGVFHHPEILGFHPLMTFNQESYDQKTYENFYFVGSSSEQTFRDLFPQLKNPYATLQIQDKALYHALCTLGGNGTTLLWKLVLTEFEKMDLPPALFKPLIDQIFQNLLNNTEGFLTGPWYRNDIKTIEKHNRVLKKTNLLPLYHSLMKEAYQKEDNL